MSDNALLKLQMLKLLDRHAELFPEVLETQFPHIVQRIITLWQTPDLDRYLHGLLSPAKPGCAGFPKAALIEIAALKAYRHHCMNKEGDTAGLAKLHPCPRETFLALVDFDFSDYPQTLENRYPELLGELAKQLDKPTFPALIDRLLSPSGQVEHAFSERALIELMTIKAANSARQAAANRQHEIDPEALEASIVFDAIHRW